MGDSMLILQQRVGCYVSEGLRYLHLTSFLKTIKPTLKSNAWREWNLIYSRHEFIFAEYVKTLPFFQGRKACKGIEFRGAMILLSLLYESQVEKGRLHEIARLLSQQYDKDHAQTGGTHRPCKWTSDNVACKVTCCDPPEDSQTSDEVEEDDMADMPTEPPLQVTSDNVARKVTRCDPSEDSQTSDEVEEDDMADMPTEPPLQVTSDNVARKVTRCDPPEDSQTSDEVEAINVNGGFVYVVKHSGILYVHFNSLMRVLKGTNDITHFMQDVNRFGDDVNTGIKIFMTKISFWKHKKACNAISMEGAMRLLHGMKSKMDYGLFKTVSNALLGACQGDKSRMKKIWNSYECTDIVPIVTPNGMKIEQRMIDGVQYLNMTDVVMTVCQVKKVKVANQIWKRIPIETKEKLAVWIKETRFLSNPSKPKYGIEFQGAIWLIFSLPGTIARSKCLEFVNIIVRYYAGDKTMLKEIVENAQSESGLNVTAREAISGTTQKRKTREFDVEDCTGREVVPMFNREHEDMTLVMEKAPQYLEFYKTKISLMRDMLTLSKEELGLQSEKFDLEARRLEMLRSNDEVKLSIEKKRTENEILDRNSRLEYQEKQNELALQMLKEKAEHELEIKKSDMELDNQRDMFKLAMIHAQNQLKKDQKNDVQIVQGNVCFNESQHCTVRSVFNKNKHLFKNQKNIYDLNLKTGSEVADIYIKEKGSKPPKVGGEGPCFYPIQYEDTILSVMKAVNAQLGSGDPRQPSMVGFITRA